MEKVRGTVSMELGNRSLPHVFALDANGNQTSEIQTKVKKGRISIPLGESPLYEIRFAENKLE